MQRIDEGITGHAKLDALQRDGATTLWTGEQRGAGLRWRTRNAIGVAWIVTGERVKEQRAILGAPSDGSNVIERPAQRDHTVATDTSIGRLETGRATTRRGNADRAAGIAANRAQAHARDHRSRRAAAGATGDA